MSEKKTVSFFRLAATATLCLLVKIELYNWAGRNLANFDDGSARLSVFLASSICVRLSSMIPREMAIMANRTTSQLRLRWRVPMNASNPETIHRRQIFGAGGRLLGPISRQRHMV